MNANQQLSPEPSAISLRPRTFRKRSWKETKEKEEEKKKKVSRALNNFHSDKTHAHLGYESTLADYKVRAVDKVARHHDARPRLMIIIKKRLNVTICASGRTRNSIVVIKG